MEEERISIEELEKLLKELEKGKEKELIIPVVPQIPQMSQLTVTVSTAVSEERAPSFAELAEKFEELTDRLEVVEKAITKGICYHVKLPFAKDEEYATVCRYHDVDEKTAELLTDLLFKYYKHASIALQAINELDECESYPPSYHVVMFTDPIRLAVLYSTYADLTYVFKLQENEHPEIIRITVDVGDARKPRLRNMCRVASVHDIEAIKVNLLEALDMPLQLDDEKDRRPVHDPDAYWKYSLPGDT
jgi:hypothetical protein